MCDSHRQRSGGCLAFIHGNPNHRRRGRRRRRRRRRRRLEKWMDIYIYISKESLCREINIVIDAKVGVGIESWRVGTQARVRHT